MNESGTEGNDRYMGFSKDLMDHIAERLNFTYEIHLTPDGKYGNRDPHTNQWNGLIRDLLEKVHDEIKVFHRVHQLYHSRKSTWPSAI